MSRKKRAAGRHAAALAAILAADTDLATTFQGSPGHRRVQRRSASKKSARGWGAGLFRTRSLNGIPTKRMDR